MPNTKVICLLMCLIIWRSLNTNFLLPSPFYFLLSISNNFVGNSPTRLPAYLFGQFKCRDLGSSSIFFKCFEHILNYGAILRQTFLVPDMPAIPAARSDARDLGTPLVGVSGSWNNPVFDTLKLKDLVNQPLQGLLFFIPTGSSNFLPIRDEFS